MPSIETFAAFAAIVALIVTSPGPNLFLLLRNTPCVGALLASPIRWPRLSLHSSG